MWSLPNINHNPLLSKITAFLALTLLMPNPAYSQINSTSISVSPAIIEQVLDVGSSKSFEVNVYNPLSRPVPIKAIVKNFQISEIVSPGNKAAYNTTSWITLDPSAFILNPNGQKTINIVLQIPKDASPGGHYATIFFEPLIQQSNNQNSSVNLSSRVGILLFLIIRGDIVEKIRLSDYQVPIIKQPGHIDFKISLRNEGNVHAMPHGSLDVYNSRNKLVDRIYLPASIIMPGTSKNYTVTFKAQNPFGRYWVQPEIYSGDYHQFLSHEKKYFWIIPINKILWFVLLTLNVIYLTIKRRKIIKAIKIIFKNNQ